MHVKYASPDEAAEGGYSLAVEPYHEALGAPLKVRTKPVASAEGDASMRQGVVVLEVPKSKVEDFELKDAGDGEELSAIMLKASRGTRLAYSSETKHD
jgi:hypothetical protein